MIQRKFTEFNIWVGNDDYLIKLTGVEIAAGVAVIVVAAVVDVDAVVDRQVGAKVCRCIGVVNVVFVVVVKTLAAVHRKSHHRDDHSGTDNCRYSKITVTIFF